jgi:hypothetical protein
MVRITIDEELQRKLLSSGEVVELCDEAGKLLGRLPVQRRPTRRLDGGYAGTHRGGTPRSI